MRPASFAFARRGQTGSTPGSLADLRPPRDCVARLQRYAAAGCRRITFGISTMGDPMAQLRRLVEEVLPFV
jgi:hypothetical protein